VGAYDLAGELMARVYDEIEQGQRGRGPKAAQARAVTKRHGEWRELFLFCRAWHLVSRFGMGLDKHADDEVQRLQALALAYPAAFPEHVWGSGRSHDIDPLLVLAVMRQESQYRSWAVSSADAQGLMQILPVTGALVARDLGRERYSPRELLDPATNIHFGAWYLQRLVTRFRGSLPLAVAAYNAGPHQAAAWLNAQDPSTPVDDWVEMIPVTETRGYVKRVLGFYSLYAQVHGPEGARVALQLQPSGDDPAVIDY
jgi:soluble lytic murein transglycosylase-like protein